MDDEPRVLSALRRGLRREPVEIETAGDGEQALELLEAQSFALVISDQKMPGMSGIELLTEIHQKWPATRRVLLSGWSTEIPADQIAAAGLIATLPKPWDDAEMRDTIRRAVGLPLAASVSAP